MRQVYTVVCVENDDDQTLPTNYVLQGWSYHRVVANWVCGRELMTMPENDYCIVKVNYDDEVHAEELHMKSSWMH